MRHSRGLSLVTAIFILLILAALSVYIAHLSASQHAESALDIQSARAYQAARAGVEFGAYQTIVGGGGCAAATASVALTGTFNGFTVSVTCASDAHVEGVTSKTLYRLTSTACNQPAAGSCPNPAPGANYVERQVQMSAINPP